MAKIMYFLTGNAEGFRVSEKTILDRCNISESGYKKARKKLVEKKWIFHKPGEYIQVNFNKIYSDYKALQARSSQETTEKISLEGQSGVSTTDEVFPVYTPHISENTESEFPEYPYNNINNNIRDTIKNNISENNMINESCEDTRFAVVPTAPQVSSQSLREKFHTREESKKAWHEYEVWFTRQERLIEEKYNIHDEEEYVKMMRSDERKAFLEEAKKKRKACEEEYGKW